MAKKNCKLYPLDQFEADGQTLKPNAVGIDLSNKEAVQRFLLENAHKIDPEMLGVKPKEKVDDDNAREVLRKYTEYGGADEAVKEELLSRGIGYAVRGREMLKKEAAALFKTNMAIGGIDAAKKFYYNSQIKGDTQNHLAGLLYQELSALKDQSTTVEEIQKYKNEISDLLMDVAERGTDAGQTAQSIKDFYDKVVNSNPEAYVQFVKKQDRKTAHEKLDRGGLADDVRKGSKILKDFIGSDELNALVGDLVNEEIDKILKASSNAKRTDAQKKAINNFFDAIKITPDKGAIQNDITFGLSYYVYNNAVELMRKLVLLGVDKAEVIRRTIAHIKTQQDKALLDGKITSTDFDQKELEDFLKEKLSPLYGDMKEMPKATKEAKKKILMEAIVSAAEKEMRKGKKTLKDKATLGDLVEATITDPFGGKTPIDLFIDTKNPKVKTVIDRYIAAVGELTDKLKNLNETTARRIASETVIKAAENGYFNNSDYKDTFARVMGISVMSDKTLGEIENLAKTISNFDKMQNKYFADPNSVDPKAYKQARLNAQKANQKISWLMGKLSKTDLWVSLMKLSLLNTVSLSRNVLGNIVYTPLVKTPSYAIASGLDYLLTTAQKNSKLSEKYDGRRTVDTIRNQRQYFQSAFNGFATALEELRYGRLSDTPSSIDTRVNLKPFSALTRIYEGLTGQERLTANEYLYRSMEAVFGLEAEPVARLLNLGDRPFSQASGDMLASMFAKEYGITVEELKKNKEKYEFENDLIDNEAMKAVFSQPNLLSKKIEAFGKTEHGKKMINGTSMASKVARLFVAMNSPYVRVPTNILIEGIKLKIPEVALFMGFSDALKASDTKKYNSQQRFEYRRSAMVNFGTAIWGTTIAYVAYSLIEAGLIGGGEDEKKKKERLAAGQYGGLNTLRVSEDYSIDLGYYGLTGLLLSSHADDYYAMQKERAAEGKPLDWKGQTIPFTYLFDGEFGDYGTALGQKFVTATKGVTEIGFFANQYALVGAINEGNIGNAMNRYMAQLGRVLLSPTMPANVTFATSFNKDYKFTTADDNALNSLWKEYKKTYGFGDELPKQRNLFGEPVSKVPNDSNSILYYLFGIRKNNPQQFGIELFNKWKETRNADYLPTPPDRTIKYKGENIKIPYEMKDRLDELIGGYRKNLLQYYMDGVLVPNGVKLPTISKPNAKEPSVIGNNTFDTDNEEIQLKTLKSIYEQGAKLGNEQVIKEFASYFEEQAGKIKRIKKQPTK